ncbi:MAG: RsmB/NOP family class I SAM-dependent RNA methyltransferase, partial [Magnetococcales bacterium]|nr:RsmB/NOP family class I SAM-dependent RNA methyltransferase [Magnetococcales bacterium]
IRATLSHLPERTHQHPENNHDPLPCPEWPGTGSDAHLHDAHLARVEDPILYSLPDDLWEMLVEQYGDESARQLATSLKQTAPLDLRVNLRKTSREKVVEMLAEEELEAEIIDWTPAGVRLQGRVARNRLTPVTRGLAEIQDIGSQCIAPLLTAKPTQHVVDLCAGAGGKSLHIADLMENKGRITALDTSAGRLKAVGPRSRRAGVRIIRTQAIRHEADPKLRPLTGKVDAVLVDAPCTGIGTLRRTPETAWRLTEDAITTFTLRQGALLDAGARLVRPGGTLVYATCSLLSQENQQVVKGFLNDQPGFKMLNATAILNHAGFTLDPEQNPWESGLALLPHQHGCDGFYMAVFRRK